jgi:hypothetical protein
LTNYKYYCRVGSNDVILMNKYKILEGICYPNIQPKIVLLKIEALGSSTILVSVYPNRRRSSQGSIILDFPSTSFM